MARYDDADVERRLRADARNIDAEVSPELRSRIRASIHAAARLRSVAVPQKSGSGLSGSYWWASGLTGLAAALLIFLMINRNQDYSEVPSGDEVATTVTPETVERLGSIPLKARTADLTGPLEEELLRLQSDLEKARSKVEQDIRSTL